MFNMPPIATPTLACTEHPYALIRCDSRVLKEVATPPATMAHFIYSEAFE